MAAGEDTVPWKPVLKCFVSPTHRYRMILYGNNTIELSSPLTGIIIIDN